MDATSVESFADGGLTAMTALSFPPAPYSELRLRAEAGSGLEVERMELEWMEVAQYAVK